MTTEITQCTNCDNTGWVCENHTNAPWKGISDRFDACDCLGAGLPCKFCNPCDEQTPPHVNDLTVIIDKDGSRH